MSDIILRDELHNRPSWVLSFYGAGGSGKTTLGLFLMDKWFPDDELAFFRYPPKAMASLPDRMRRRSKSFTRMDQIIGSPHLVFLDDTALHFLSRQTSNKDNQDLVKQLTIARHNDQRFLITAQNSILVDKGLFESLDQFSLRCRMTDFQARTERPEFIDIQLKVNDLIASLPETNGRYWYCMESGELFCFPGWPDMNESLSKPYQGVVVSNGQLERL